MKQALIAILFCCIQPCLFGQYYLRGEVRDEKGGLLSGVRIMLASKGSYPFASGNAGAFGIPVAQFTDTLTASLEGYEEVRKAVRSDQYQSIVLKMLPSTANARKNHLLSRTRNMSSIYVPTLSGPGESYSSLAENEFVDARVYPETGFSLTVDRASYSNIRRFISNDMLVPPDAVRIEEMLNYFNLSLTSTEPPPQPVRLQHPDHKLPVECRFTALVHQPDRPAT